MTIYEKIVFITIVILIHLFVKVGYIKINKILRTAILILDIFFMWIMYDHLMYIEKHKVLYLVYNSMFLNVFVMLLYMLIVSVIGLTVKKDKFEKCIKPLTATGLTICVFLCLYDINVKQPSDDYLYDKPYPTIKQLEPDNKSYNSAHVSSNVFSMRNLMVKQAYISEEIMFVSSERKNLDIKCICTQYYEFHSKYVLPERLIAELTDSNDLIKWKKIDDTLFDEIYYREIFLNDDKDIYITYRYNETVVQVQFFVEKDYDIEKIINIIEYHL